MSVEQIQSAYGVWWALGSRDHPCIWDNYSMCLKHTEFNECKIMVYDDL